MSSDTLIDDLEIDYGTAILSELTGERLTRNGQPVRLFDGTKHSAEVFYRADRQGKPYIQDFQQSKRYYPVTAYCQTYGLDFDTALTELCQRYGFDNTPRRVISRTRPARPVQPPRRVDHLPVDVYERSRSRFHRNGLYEYLRFTFGQAEADAAFARYRLGTSRRWQYYGYLATCLPQFDAAGYLRQVKIMPFDAMSGRRVKKHQPAQQWNHYSGAYEPTQADIDKIYFAGKQIAKDAGMTNVHLAQCFFGEHLLAECSSARVALVEGESTALIGSIIRSQYVWLATGGNNGARWTDPETFGVLRERDVVLWPDKDAHETWVEKARTLRPLVRSMKVTDFVKCNAPETMGKADLRDVVRWPFYAPGDSSSKIFGEPLQVEEADSYPPSWDEPNPPDAVPIIKPLSANEYLNPP